MRIPRLHKEISLFSRDEKKSIGAALRLLADRISLVVTGDSTSSSLTITEGAMEAITGQLTIKGSDGTTTVVEGGRIQADSLSIGDVDGLDDELADAAATATNHIKIDTDGIRIANASPSIATTYQHQTADGTEFVVDGVSRGEIAGDGARFGTAAESNLNIDYHSIQLKDKDGYTYFHISDLRDHDGKYEITQKFKVGSDTYVYEGTAEFYLNGLPQSTDYEVTINDSGTYTVSKGLYKFEVTPVPPIGTIIYAKYWTISGNAKAYTIGQRSDQATEPIGPRSYVIGMQSSATGEESMAIGSDVHSEGFRSIAIGQNGAAANGINAIAIGPEAVVDCDYSAAIGPGTFANESHLFAIGQYNAMPDPNDGIFFVIGSGIGTDPDERENAVEIDRNGGIFTGQDIKDWQNIEIDPDNNGFVEYNSNQRPKGRRFGHMVELCGAVKPTSSKASGSNLTFARVPWRLTPDREVVQLCQGSNESSWLLTINTSGYLSVSRYRNGGSAVAIPNNAWLTFHVVYMVKEYLGG